MAKKVAAKLTSASDKIYAILLEGEGYQKIAYGEVKHGDNLPRASGCYATLELAREGRKQAIEAAEKIIEDRKDNTYWASILVENLENAKKAKIVEISMRVVE